MHNPTNPTDSFSELLRSFMASKGISPESIGYALREPVALVERWVDGSILPSERVLCGIVRRILELSPCNEAMLVDAYARTKAEGHNYDDLKLLWINAAPACPSLAFSLLFDHLYVEFDVSDNAMYCLQFDVAAKGIDVKANLFVDSVLTYVAIDRGVFDRMETVRFEVVDFAHTDKNLVSRLVMNAQPLLQRVFGLDSSNSVQAHVKAQFSKQPIDPDRAFSLVDSVRRDGSIKNFRSREYRQREYAGMISFDNKPSCYIEIEVLRSDIDSVHHVWVTIDCMHALSEQEKSDIEQVVRSTLHGFVWRWGALSGSLPITIVYSSSKDDGEFESRKSDYEFNALVANLEGYTPYQHPIDWLDDAKTCGLFEEMYLEVEREPMVIVEDGVRREMRLHVMVDTTIEDAETLARLVDGLSAMITRKEPLGQYAVIRFFIKMPMRSDEKVIRFVDMINANATNTLRLLMVPDDDPMLNEVLKRGQQARSCAHIPSDNVGRLEHLESRVDEMVDKVAMLIDRLDSMNLS